MQTAPPKKWRHCAAVTILTLLMVGCGLLPATLSTPVPPINTESLPDHAAGSLAALQEAVAPERDLTDLAQRLGGRADAANGLPDRRNEREGDIVSFWYKDHDDESNVRVDAQLVSQSPHLNLWVEVGSKVNEAQLQEAVAILEEQIIPTNLTFFGAPPVLGASSERRINILHIAEIGGNVVGYFSAADSFVEAVNPYSNERQMFYISLKHAPIGSDAYYQVIAHEMQHMIHWAIDSNEATWLDEGMAVLAAALNGFTEVGFDSAYGQLPDVQLNNFDYEQDGLAHYGASYLFAAYYLDRFGAEATQALVSQQENGINGVEAAMADLGLTLSFDDLFADWSIANYLDSLDRGEGVHDYSALKVPPLALAADHTRLPDGSKDAVHQFAVDYIGIEDDAPVTLVFTGTRRVQMLPTRPHSGDYFWSTIPADDSDMTMTGHFDLSAVETATLNFWTWYDIEEGWDYAYVTVSDDNGASWQLLETPDTTEDNPHGNSYGPALTGRSGREDVSRWVQQQADLTPFVGRPILVRFEYITDDAAQRPGLALDDIAIPEIDFSDDVESGPGIWDAKGFVRHANVLPQFFSVQAILIADNSVRVLQLPVNEKQEGRWTLELDENFDKAILVIAGTTPVTTLPASYSYWID